jgi:MerR family redox-sensitive transcriptional activator SoxR
MEVQVHLNASRVDGLLCGVAKRFTIREVAERSGVATSALRFYEAKGLLTSERDPRGHRRYPPDVLRRVAFITVGQSLGIPLSEIGAVLAGLPGDRTPNKRDWERVSRAWAAELDARIARLQTMRDRLTSCIGCGCLSLRECSLSNRRDRAGQLGAGPRYLLGDTPVPQESRAGA